MPPLLSRSEAGVPIFVDVVGPQRKFELSFLLNSSVYS